METYDYEFVSCFGEHIETFISLKRKNGFVYNSEAYLLKKFDEFSAGRSESGPGISRELASAWGTLRDSETRQYLSKRMSVLRKLCIYLIFSELTAMFQELLHIKAVMYPIVHSLRHSFVVKRMNLWMENNEDLKALMTDEELEQLAPWNKTVKVEFQRRVDSQNNE